MPSSKRRHFSYFLSVVIVANVLIYVGMIILIAAGMGGRDGCFKYLEAPGLDPSDSFKGSPITLPAIRSKRLSKLSRAPSSRLPY